MLTFETKIHLPADPRHHKPKNWGSVSRRDGMARARCLWSSMEAGQKCPPNKGEIQRSILLTLEKRRSLAPSNPQPEDREFVVYCGASMHMICKKVSNDARHFDDVEKSNDSQQPMEKCRRMKRPQFTSKNWTSSLVSRKALRCTGRAFATWANSNLGQPLLLLRPIAT